MGPPDRQDFSHESTVQALVRVFGENQANQHQAGSLCWGLP